MHQVSPVFHSRLLALSIQPSPLRLFPIEALKIFRHINAQSLHPKLIGQAIVNKRGSDIAAVSASEETVDSVTKSYIGASPRGMPSHGRQQRTFCQLGMGEADKARLVEGHSEGGSTAPQEEGRCAKSDRTIVRRGHDSS